MIRSYHHSNVLNHIKITFLFSCCSSLGSPDIAQETGVKLHCSITFSIEQSPNLACFWAFRHLIFENQGIFGHNINRLSYSCGLLIAFFQILWAIIGWKTFLVSFFSGHWNFIGWLTNDVIMAKIIGRAIASLRKQSWPLPPVAYGITKLCMRRDWFTENTSTTNAIFQFAKIENHSVIFQLYFS